LLALERFQLRESRFAVQRRCAEGLCGSHMNLSVGEVMQWGREREGR
jgi:hypothetical protein